MPAQLNTTLVLWIDSCKGNACIPLISAVDRLPGLHCTVLVVNDDVILHHRACAYLNKLAAAIIFILKFLLKLFVLALLRCQSLS